MTDLEVVASWVHEGDKHSFGEVSGGWWGTPASPEGYRLDFCYVVFYTSTLASSGGCSLV